MAQDASIAQVLTNVTYAKKIQIWMQLLVSAIVKKTSSFQVKMEAVFQRFAYRMNTLTQRTPSVNLAILLA